MDVDGALTEALDGSEDVVGAFDPAERLRIGVVRLDVGGDGRLEFRGGAVGAAPDLVVGQQSEEALDLVDPGGRGRRAVDLVARPLRQPVPDRLGFVGRRVTEQEWIPRLGGT